MMSQQSQDGMALLINVRNAVFAGNNPSEPTPDDSVFARSADAAELRRKRKLEELRDGDDVMKQESCDARQRFQAITKWRVKGAAYRARRSAHFGFLEGSDRTPAMELFRFLDS